MSEISMPAGPQVQAFKLDQQGLARVFGELEAEIMDIIWSDGESSVAAVCDRLGPESNYKTVTTVMNRLVAKQVLSRRREQRAFVYMANEARANFETRLSRRVAEGLVRDYGDLALAQFVDALGDIDPELLGRLGDLVRTQQSKVRDERDVAEVAE